MRFVIFLTDGFIGNEAEILGELQNTLGENTRLFSVGVGSSPNRYLIEGLAEEGRGHAYYVGLNEDPTEAVSAIYEKINDPYLIGISIDWGDLDIHDIYPSRIPDLYAGEPLVIVGQYDGSGSETVHLSGVVAGRRWNRDVRIVFPAHEEDNDVIATLWARKKIHDLNRQMYNSYGYIDQNQDIIEEITDTALDYQIMSEYTSFVAVCEEIRTDPDGNPVTVQVPVNMPEGVSYEGVFGTESESGTIHYSMNRSVSGSMQSAPVAGLGAGGYVAFDVCEESINGDYYYEYEETPWFGSVGLVSASPTLGLRPSVVRSAVRELLAELTEVYQSYLDGIEDADEWATGVVTFKIEVDSDGNITAVSLIGSGLERDVDDYLCEVLEGLNIPTPPDGAGSIQVQLSFQKTF